MGTQSYPTLFVREPIGPFLTNGCRAPERDALQRERDLLAQQVEMLRSMLRRRSSN